MQKIFYKGQELELFVSSYQNNDALYVGLKDEDGEYYGDITVNLANSHTLPSDCAYIDENNMPRIADVLMDEGLAQPIHQSVQSGFCRYFAFRFNLDVITNL